MIEHLSSLSLRHKIGQLFFIGIAGPEVDSPTRELLDEVSPGGVCLFARNIRETRQTRDLLDEIRVILPATPFLSVDQEGGLVDRLRRVMTPMPAASKIRNAAEASQLAAIIGETLRILGFNMDFAPVVDVIDESRSKYSNGLFSRTFGHSKEDTTAFAGEFLNALQKNGIVGCLKHFPGLGAAHVDSHEELPSVEISESELFETDLFPYRELLASGGVHATRRSESGVSRFSTGSDSASATPVTAARAALSRRSASGFLSAHTRGGGMESPGTRAAGGSAFSAPA